MNNILPDHPFDWRILESRDLIHDRWMHLRADTCQMPSGKVIEPFYVLEYRDWINVVAITPRMEVVLVREYRHGIGRTILELPSGGVDPNGETPLETARRELLEETGYGGTEWIELCQLSPNPANHTNMTYSFLALNVERQAEAGSNLDDTEEIEVVLLPLSQVAEMLRSNQFLQAMHTSALFYALLKLENLGIGY